MRKRPRLGAVILVLAMLAALLPVMPVRAAASATPFMDVWQIPQEPQITALWQLGVVTGTSADRYSPAGNVTRAQMAALIIRAMGKTADADQLQNASLEFNDVPRGHWARGLIALASQMGFIKGDAGKFQPDSPVNYAQAVTMLVRALGYENQVAGGYPTGYVMKASDLGLIKDSSFELFAVVNRAEAAVLLYNAIYRAPVATTKQTWSQSYFRRASALTLSPLPPYVAPGQQVTLQATAKDLVGNPIPDAAIVYSVQSGTGTIGGQSLTIGDGGPLTVQAKLGDLTAQTTVTPVSGLTITPATFQANKGGTFQLKATAMSGGQSVVVQPEWTVTQGPATVDASGLVTVNDYGTVTVQAKLGSLTAVSNGQAVGKVTITTNPDYLVPGQSVSFTANAVDSAGKTINVPVTWSAANATMNPTTGLLTNPRGAQAVVTATAGGISAQVTIPVLQSIQITGASDTVLVSKKVNFEAQALDATGKSYPIKPNWDRSSATVGIVGADGSFVGLTPGVITVTASLGSLQGQKTLRVAGTPATIGLITSVASLPAGTGNQATITVRLLDATGAVSPVDDQPVVLALSDSGGGSLSRTVLLTKQGEATTTYTPGATAASVTIAATAPGSTLAAQTLAMATYTQQPHHIDLSANPNPLMAGGSVTTVTVTLKDVNGQPAVASQALYVTIANSGGNGSLVGNPVVTIPAGQTSGSVTFISSSQPGTAVLTGTGPYPVNPVTLTTTTAGPPARVKIRPLSGPVPVNGLSSLVVQVDVADAAGVVIANDSTSKVQLVAGAPSSTQGSDTTSTQTAVGGTATFQVPAYAIGTVALTASLVSNPAATDTATAEFVPGVSSSIRLTAQTSDMIANGVSTGTVVAEVVDKTGTVLTNVNTIITFRKLVDQGATVATSTVAIPAVNGKAVLSLRSTYAAGTDIWFAEAPGLDTQNLATITTSTVGAGATLRVTGAGSLGVGVSGTLSVQVLDSLGQVVTTDTGRTIYATTGLAGLSIAPPSATTQNGVATFTIVGTQSGSGTITFSSAGFSSVQAPVGIGVAVPAYSLFASSSTGTAQVGVPVTVWARVMDNQGQTVTTDSGRVVTAAVSGHGTLSATQATTSSGVATFTFTPTSIGTVTITFTSTGLTQPTAQLSITITQ